MTARVLHNDSPQRSVAIVNPSHTLIFQHVLGSRPSASSASLAVDREAPRSGPLCAVEFSAVVNADLQDYSVLSKQPCLGCLGLINIARDTFLCVITTAKEVAQVRPGEMVYRILAVEFRM
jgi:hypothetical protein